MTIFCDPNQPVNGKNSCIGDKHFTGWRVGEKCLLCHFLFAGISYGLHWVSSMFTNLCLSIFLSRVLARNRWHSLQGSWREFNEGTALKKLKVNNKKQWSILLIVIWETVTIFGLMEQQRNWNLGRAGLQERDSNGRDKQLLPAMLAQRGLGESPPSFPQNSSVAVVLHWPNPPRSQGGGSWPLWPSGESLLGCRTGWQG